MTRIHLYMLGRGGAILVGTRRDVQPLGRSALSTGLDTPQISNLNIRKLANRVGKKA